jgi:mono/diheme cytochrome c family protein
MYMKNIKKLCVMIGVAGGILGLVSAAHAADAELIKRGEYLATAGDCIACHTAPAGKPYAGGLAVATPLGKIVSTNITPSKIDGIGNYTLEQFSDALRRGVRADGQHLYPAMPYTSYEQLNSDDVKALYAYFLQGGVEAVDSKPAATALPFPFNIRLSMAAWNLMFLDRKPFVPDAGKSAEWNRGAYLTLGLAHCSTCHTPRNALMAEDTSRLLAGAEVGGWYAPNISADPVSGIGGWSEAEIAEYLRSGRANGKAQAGGPMAEVIDNSLLHMSDADRKAIAVYLKAGAAQHNAGDNQAAYSWGKPAMGVEATRGAPLVHDTASFNGAQLYDANCASCHQAHAEGSALWGSDGASLPSLFHNTALGHANSNNLVMAILAGVARKSGDVMMPAFDKELSNEQIATLGNYLLQTYGNPAAKVTVEQVRALRAGGAAPPLVLLVRAAIIAAILVFLLIVIWLIIRRRRRRA